MKLTFEAVGILTSVLAPTQMQVIFLMGMGMILPDEVTKQDLVNVISVLCKKLDWIEEEKGMNEILKTGSNDQDIEMKLTREAIGILSNSWNQIK